MPSKKSIEPLSFRQIDFLFKNWPDENDLEPRPKLVIRAWRATSSTEITRLVQRLHEDESCHYRVQDTGPFRKDQKIQAIIAYQVPIPGSDVLPLTMAELRSVATTYGDTASEILVRDSASQFSVRTGNSQVTTLSNWQKQLSVLKRAIRLQEDYDADADPASNYSIH